jgi:hypothetical protein
MIGIRNDAAGEPFAPNDGTHHIAQDIRHQEPIMSTPWSHADHDEAFAPIARWPLVVAILALVLWIGGALWLARDTLPTLDAIALVQFIAALAVVPTLIGVVWLLANRTSRSEATRFGATAQAMRAESAALEHRVAAMVETLDVTRTRLAEQAAALAAMADSAKARLAGLSEDVTQQVAQIDAHARGLAESSTVAQSSLGVLLASLPRAHDDTDAVARKLQAIGLSASEHAGALDAQLAALAERGREADLVAGGAAQRLAAHITRMEATSETAGARLEAVTGEMSVAVDALLGRTADAVDEARKGIAAQGDAMLAMLGTNQAALDRAARDSADALAGRIAAVHDAIDQVATRLDVQRVAGDAIVEGLETGLGRVDGQLDALHRQGTDRSQMLAASISALGGSADAMTEALKAGEAMALRTIGTTESLLIALDSAAREIDETLPEALQRLNEHVAFSRKAVGQTKPELLALVGAAETTHDAIEAIAGVIAEQRRTLDALSGGLLQTMATGRTEADALGVVVDETLTRTHRLVQEATPRLVDALSRVQDAATNAAERARETLATVIPHAADALETASAQAIARATGDAVERHVHAIVEATAAAVDAAQGATERLTGQVRTIAEQTAIVEARIVEARTEREDADQDTFGRRASLLIETLNSAAIDITKSFAPEVSDSAWGAYLKGDRGVFTRRAVRILDAVQAREIARLYDDDSRVREMINRYIHDFEAMLRTILAQRDGSPLGVTLLSSDMGKLYVALAQAIERLR